MSSNTLISDTVLFIRDNLSSNITDPISSVRTGDERFVMTSYPKRSVKYPLITVRSDGIEEIQKTGFRSELKWVKLPMEIRIWARNEKERDNLTEQTLNQLRTNQYDGGSSSSDDQGLHDFKINSVVLVDDPDEQGKEAIKSAILRVDYNFMYGS